MDRMFDGFYDTAFRKNVALLMQRALRLFPGVNGNEMITNTRYRHHKYRSKINL